MVRVDRLSRRNDDSLDTDIAEGGVDESGQEATEVPSRASNPVIICPRTRVFPVSKADRVMSRCTTGGNHDGHQHQSEEAKDLDSTSGDFDIAIPPHVDQIAG